jgi:hypothetical protein
VLPRNKTAFSSNSIRILCDKIPPHAHLGLVLAVVKDLPLDKVKNLTGTVEDTYAEKPTLKDVWVSATFTSVGGRPRNIEDKPYSVDVE